MTRAWLVADRRVGLAALLAAAQGAACAAAAPPSTAATPEAALEADIERVRRVVEERSTALDEAERSTAELIGGVRAVVDAYERARASYAQAESTWQTALSRYDAASEEFLAAAQTYRDVAERYRLASIVLIGIASLDMVGTGLCDSRVSTRAFRARLRAQGVHLHGRDVDHIIPRSLGGPEHPANYQLLPSSLNRSLQASGLLEKFAAAPMNFVLALATTALVALACGG